VQFTGKVTSRSRSRTKSTIPLMDHPHVSWRSVRNLSYHSISRINLLFSSPSCLSPSQYPRVIFVGNSLLLQSR
jgi:hypothetical protein